MELLRKFKQNKKGGAIDFLRSAILGVVICAITLTIVLQVNDTITKNIDSGTSGYNTSSNYEVKCAEACPAGVECNWTCTTSYYNASVKGTTGMAAFADYWTVIAIVVILATLILLFGVVTGGKFGGIDIQ